MSFNATAQYREIVLRKVRFAMAAHLSLDLLASTEADVFLDQYSASVVVRLQASVLGETVPEVDVKFPVTWWDAVKDRWFPKWSLRWFPVEYRRITIDKHTLFPSIEVPGHEARIAVTNRDHRWWDYGKDDE